MSEKSEMKPFSLNFTPLFFTVVAGIIVALFAWWLNSEKFDLRYTLSEKIPLRFGGASEEAVQQIEVKNLSKRPIERIQVKLPPQLTTYEVSKNSQADQFEHFKNAQSEEFIYPTLPPQGSFRIVFKTPGEGVAKSQVQVTHNKGEATYALETGGRSTSVFAWAALLGPAIWLFLSFFSLRSTLIDSWSSDAEYRSERVVRRSIPFYMSNEKWAEIRTKAIANLGKYPYESVHDDIEDLSCYKWLNREKPNFLSGDEWDVLRKASTERLRAAFGKRLESFWSGDEVPRYLRIKKPVQYASGKWEELRVELQEKFLRRRASEGYDNPVLKLQETKPEGIEQPEWTKSQAKLIQRLASQLYDAALREDSPLSYVKKQNLNVLPKDTADELLNKAYKAELKRIPDLVVDANAEKFLGDGKPAWMSDEDYSTYKQKAERTLRVAKKDVLNGLLERILFNVQLPKKELEVLDSELQEKLRKMDEEIRLAKEKNRSEAERISKESQELASDREKVLKQLQILNNLFTDPLSIDRVESYDNPFASGNFELLRKVSMTLRAADKR
ncbi:MAG: hypothetical protein HY298_27065 [Verrucomicrobia bacterium]|nr:hypothetical protein [Verrucomicrobiota bacterium]